MADDSNQICFIDVETTGIGAFGNKLLEVAVIITDKQLNILDASGFQREIYYSPEEVLELKSFTSDYVIDMHTKTGLWDRLSTHGTPQEQVDAEMLAYMQEYIPESNSTRLAGNSVSLDKEFINTYLPNSGGYLHFRIVDISSIAGLGDWWYGTRYQKKNTHSAMDDIRESVAELQFLRKKIFK